MNECYQRKPIHSDRSFFIDSAGLGMLLLARDEGKRKNLDVCLRRPRGQVKRMLEVARFDTMFTIEE